MKHRKSDHPIAKHLQFERIYGLYSSRIYNFVLKISLGNIYVAEEITQIVFLKLWEKFDNIDTGNDENLKSYLFTIARNTLLNYLKHETIQFIYLNYLKDEPCADYSTQDIIDSSFFNGYVIKLINELPPIRQKVFSMSRLQHLTNRHIAQELGISVSTVETHLSLALKFMREELRKRYGIISALAVVLSATIYCI